MTEYVVRIVGETCDDTVEVPSREDAIAIANEWNLAYSEILLKHETFPLIWASPQKTVSQIIVAT